MSSLQPKKVPVSTTLQPFICGGASAMLASSCIHPIDLAKVRLQLYATTHANKPSPGFVGIIVELVKKDGISALYAGLSAALMRQAVYGTARIGLHRSISDELVRRNNGQNLSFLEVSDFLYFLTKNHIFIRQMCIYLVEISWYR